MKSSTTDAIRSLADKVKAKCEAAVVEPQDQVPSGYDGYLLVRLPSEWLPSRVLEFQEWAWGQAYEVLMNDGVDIHIEAWNLTRNQQELVKWIYVRFPDIQEEELHASGIKYNRDAAREWYHDHDERVDERLIQRNTAKDRRDIERKYTLRYGT